MAISELSVASASAMQQARVAEQVSVAVARKSLDAAEQQGAAALALLDAAAQISQPREPGKGAALDVRG